MRPRSGPGGEKMDQTQLLLNCLADESSEGIWEEWVCVLSHQRRWYKSIKNTLMTLQWKKHVTRHGPLGTIFPKDRVCWSICAAKNDASQLMMAELAHCDRMMQTVQPQKQCWHLWVAMCSTLGVCHVVSRSFRADSFICAGRLVVNSLALPFINACNRCGSICFCSSLFLFKQAVFWGGCIVSNCRRAHSSILDPQDGIVDRSCNVIIMTTSL